MPEIEGLQTVCRCSTGWALLADTGGFLYQADGNLQHRVSQHSNIHRCHLVWGWKWSGWNIFGRFHQRGLFLSRPPQWMAGARSDIPTASESFLRLVCTRAFDHKLSRCESSWSPLKQIHPCFSSCNEVIGPHCWLRRRLQKKCRKRFRSEDDELRKYEWIHMIVSLTCDSWQIEVTTHHEDHVDQPDVSDISGPFFSGLFSSVTVKKCVVVISVLCDFLSCC